MNKADIFQPENLLRCACDKVIIVGSGPNGCAAYDRILETARRVIAVNEVITAFMNYGTYWMCADWWVSKTDWFPDADQLFADKGTRVFCHTLSQQSKHFNLPRDLSFALVGTNDPTRKFNLAANDDHRLRPDETVVGCALNLAWLWGATEIALVGVDMSGDTYFNNRQRVVSDRDRRSGGERWGFTDNLNRMIWWMMSQGVKIESWTETKLAIGKQG